ncbi:hypothetical protein JCM19236_4451 [Vibrio sp. JCM 19236]|nr:hypothetical protein JCM19236_4451 [Vibrio sp. JCM 19236]
MSGKQLLPLFLTLGAVGCDSSSSASQEETFTPESITAEVQAVSPATNRARQASAAYNSIDHYFMIVWNDNRFNPDVETIELIRANYDGSFGEKIELDSTTGEDISDPTVSFNSTDNTFLTAWEKPFSSPTSSEALDKIQLSLIDSDGNITKSTTLDIGCTHGDASLEYSSDKNKWLLAWVHNTEDDEDCSENPKAGGVYVQYISASGEPEGEAKLIREEFDSNDVLNQNDTDDITGVHLAYNSQDDQYFLAWQHKYYSDTSETLRDIFYGLEGQRIDSDLNQLGGLVIIESVEATNIEIVNAEDAILDEPQEISSAYDPVSNSFAVTYRTVDYSTFESNNKSTSQIVTRIISDAGQIGSKLVLAEVEEEGPDYSDRAVDEPTVGYNPAKQNFLITWQQSPASDNLENYDYDIYSAELEPDGTLSEPKLEVSNSGINDMKADDIHEDVVCNDFVCLLLWQETATLASSEDVVPRVINFKFINNLEE